MPTVIIENKIPFINGLLDNIATTYYAGPDEIDRSLLLSTSAEAIIIRTRTRCNRQLLEGTNIKLIVTATIGTDHIDLDYCRNNGITVVNAPGCNAPAVAQYVLSTAIRLLGDVKGKTIGVIGVGHVGSIVTRWAEGLGMKVLKCDPPLALASGHSGFCDIQHIAENADIITVHTPLTRSGDYPTYHLLDAKLLENCRRKPLVINSARGSVADTSALIKAKESGYISNLAIDCWENEPDINLNLLELADVATPHIAGYSFQGKQRATRMAVEAFCNYYSLTIPEGTPDPDNAPLTVTQQALTDSYDPLSDTADLKREPNHFEALRNNYNYRPEPK